jgi:hypothetical protein
LQIRSSADWIDKEAEDRFCRFVDHMPLVSFLVLTISNHA